MNFFRKMFKGKTEKASDTTSTQTKNISNEKLISLLTAWGETESEDAHTAIVEELKGGESVLLIPTINDATNNGGGEWETATKGTQLKVTSLFMLGQEKVIAVFSSEEAFRAWNKTDSQYTVMPTKNVLKICKQLEVTKLVIDSNQSTMVVVESELL